MCGERWNPPIFLGKTIEVLMNDGSFETDFIFWLIMLIWEAFFPTATSQCKTWTQVLGACLEYIYIYVYSIYIYILYIYTYIYIPTRNNDCPFSLEKTAPDILRFGKMGVVTQIFSPQKSHMQRSRSERCKVTQEVRKRQKKRDGSGCRL